MCSVRADEFLAKTTEELVAWFRSIGLDMYSDLVQEKMLTGERLADIVSGDSTHEMVVSWCISTVPHTALPLACTPHPGLTLAMSPPPDSMSPTP